MLKKIIIPLAAFAVTVTGASAFTGSDFISKLDLSLTTEQEAALEEVREIHDKAQAEAKEVLENAGIDEAKLREIHKAAREAGRERHKEMREAIEASNYEAFKAAVSDTPLALKITNEADFSKFVEAHNLLRSGDREGAQAIMTELGIEAPLGKMGGHHGFGGHYLKGSY